MLIMGAMFQEEYEEGFVRIVSFAVRLATPEEQAQAEAAGPPPPPRAVARPEFPAGVSGDLLLAEDELRGNELTLAPETLISVEDYVAETPSGLQIIIPESPADTAGTSEPAPNNPISGEPGSQ